MTQALSAYVQLGLLALIAALLAVLIVQVNKLRARLRSLAVLVARSPRAPASPARLDEPPGERQQPAEHTAKAPPPTATPTSSLVGDDRDLRDLSPETQTVTADLEVTRADADAFATARPAGSFKEVSQQLYGRWCVEDRRPTPPDSMEIGFLRYAGDQRTSDLSPPMHVFSDDQQTGEFVRFSAQGNDRGLAFPNPEAFFSEGVHRILFPNLTADAFQNHRQLASTPPVLIQRQGDGNWQKA